MKTDLTGANLIKIIRRYGRTLGTYKAFLFFLALATLYGFIIWRINVLSNAPPSQSDILSASKQAPIQPHIDPATVSKIQSLQDNSVNVQSLFNQARQNPFQE